MPSLFVSRCNAVRKRIPFAYWIAYDVVALPLMAWGAVALSPWFCVGLAMLGFAAFFDVTEAIVKWGERA